MANVFAQYKTQSLSTMAPGELLVKLYDEVIKQCHMAKLSIDNKDYAAANNSLIKCQNIISTLADALDMRYPVSKNLRELYIFFAQQLLQANLKKETKLIDDIIPLIKDLRSSFDQADKISRRQCAVGGQAV